MKKNIVRVLSLLLVAAMLVACTACSQTVLVRFVDKDGNDVNFGAVQVGGNETEASTNNEPESTDTPSETPSSDEASEAPSADDTTTAPSGDNNTTAAPETTTNAPESTTAGSENTTAAPETTTAAPVSKGPSTKDEVIAFYSKAVNDIKNSAVAGYDKKEFQTITSFNITGVGIVDNTIKSIASNFFTDEAGADTQVNAKGSDEAKNRIEEWALKDNSKVVSATNKENGGKYTITIVMADEDTPHKGGNSHLDQVGSVLLWEDIEKELNGISQIKEWENGNVQVLYTKYTITAVMTPEGHFESITHHTDVVIQINHARLLNMVNLDNKNVAMENTVRFTNFKY